MKVEITGGNEYQKILKMITDIKMGVKAGILKGATTTDGKSIPTYAMFNEYGTKNTPPRPFLRTTAKDKGQSWLDVIVHNVKGQTQNNGAWTRALTLTGEVMKANIKETIQRGEFAPNAPGTIANKQRKGKCEPDHPLIDTGQMLAAINYEVVR